VLGQICVGWFVPADAGGPGASRDPMSLTIQLVRADQTAEGPLIGLNLVGRRPDAAARSTVNGANAGVVPPPPAGFPPAESPAALIEETILAGLPDALRQIRREISVFSGRGGTRVPGIGVALERLANRCHQLMRDACRDLEHRRRMEGRRTGHANQRARQGDRPTHKAFEDARAASDDRLFFDVQEHTVCVVGPSNRVHFFTLEAKQVTSVVFPGHVVQQRVGSKRWAQLEPDKLAAFRRALEPTTESS